MSLKNIGLFILAASLTWSCESDPKNTNTDNFDVSTILTNVADNIIIYRYENLSTAASNLETAATTFNTTSSQVNLDDLQEKFRLAYLAWQETSVFQLGYAQSNSLRATLNTFPTDTTDINTIMGSTNPDYEDTKYIGATGFPGLDFLLFSKTDADVIARFTTASNKQGAKDYLAAVTKFISTKASEATDYWKNNTDSYKSNFSSDKSKAVASAFSNLVNEFVFDVEQMKNYQLAVPAGKYTLNTPRPELTEAIYSEYNIELFKAHLAALKKLYIGEDGNGTNGIGFDDYLSELESKKSGKLLNTLILEQFDLIDDKIDLINGDLIDAINNQPQLITELFTESKLLVSYFKVDMCSEFGVQITFTDNDGD